MTRHPDQPITDPIPWEDQFATMPTRLTAELDEEGTTKLLEVLKAARSYVNLSPSHPNSKQYRSELWDKVFDFDMWEAGAGRVSVS
jgi:hypothetical protein